MFWSLWEFYLANIGRREISSIRKGDNITAISVVAIYVVALYPGLPMFFNVYKKNQEGLVDLMM